MNEDQLATVTVVAQKVARVWPDVNAEDLRNELVVRWLEQAQHTEGATAEGYWKDVQEGDQEAAGKLNRTLVNWANAWCRKETAAIRGNDDYVQYSKRMLREMLPSLKQAELWGSLAATGGGGGKRTRPAHEGGDMLATYADLTRAFDMLTPDHQYCVKVRYVDEATDWREQVMATYGCTESAAGNRVARGLEAMEIALAGKPMRDGPLERRRVMSNAAWQARLGHEYTGDHGGLPTFVQ